MTHCPCGNRLCRTDLVRVELAGAGFTECMTMALVGLDESFAYMRRVRCGSVYEMRCCCVRVWCVCVCVLFVV